MKANLGAFLFALAPSLRVALLAVKGGPQPVCERHTAPDTRA